MQLTDSKHPGHLLVGKIVEWFVIKTTSGWEIESVFFTIAQANLCGSKGPCVREHCAQDQEGRPYRLAM